MSSARRIIAANLQRVRDRIAAAAVAAEREPNSVKLVAVCKYVGPTETAALVEAGCRDLGESRPQQLWQKATAAGLDRVCWHLIGHLQRNKVRRTLPLAALLHAVDSERLLKAVDHQAGDLGLRPRVLLEINCSGDAAKHGFSPEQAPRMVEQLASLPHLSVTGLMTMAPREGGLDEARKSFATLRSLRDTLQPLCPPGVTLDELSMGMSRDLEQAIGEGATLVRVGSALFEGLL